jgi:hypothetical protein
MILSSIRPRVTEGDPMPFKGLWSQESEYQRILTSQNMTDSEAVKSYLDTLEDLHDMEKEYRLTPRHVPYDPDDLNSLNRPEMIALKMLQLRQVIRGYDLLVEQMGDGSANHDALEDEASEEENKLLKNFFYHAPEPELLPVLGLTLLSMINTACQQIDKLRANLVKKMARTKNMDWTVEISYLKNTVVLYAAVLHTMVIGIQPFTTGNGKTARMLASIVLCRGGLAPMYLTQSTVETYRKIVSDSARLYSENAGSGSNPSKMFPDSRTFYWFLCDLYSLKRDEAPIIKWNEENDDVLVKVRENFSRDLSALVADASFGVTSASNQTEAIQRFLAAKVLIDMHKAKSRSA